MNVIVFKKTRLKTQELNKRKNVKNSLQLVGIDNQL